MIDQTPDSDAIYLTRKEAAKLLRMSETWLAHQRRGENAIPCLKIGNKIFYDRNDLFAWIKRQRCCEFEN